MKRAKGNILIVMLGMVLIATVLQTAGALADLRTPLDDPRIPDGEIAVYKIQEGDREWRYTETVEVTTGTAGGTYTIANSADHESTRTILQKESMVPLSVATTATTKMIKRSTSTEVDILADIHSDDIVLISITDLRYVLRGYPFENPQDELGIAFLNSEDNDDDEKPTFEIKISFDRIEEIAVGTRSIPCYRLELKAKAFGIMRVINGFIGKTFFWYSVEQPHYLVAYEGNSSFPGSPKVRIEIEEYSGWR